MPTLVWKLLRQHISIGQLAGFFLANLFGMMIVLLSVQFYKDVIPVFTEGDSCESEKATVSQNNRSFHSFSIQSFSRIGNEGSRYSSFHRYVF